MIRKQYYIPFLPKAKVNYLYIFNLLDLASFNEETRLFDKVSYRSVQALSNDLRLSYNTVKTLLRKEAYEPFFTDDRENKEISLNCDFKSNRIPFVVISKRERDFLKEQNDNLLCRYFIYLKYYCGLRPDKQDFTIKQFLAACGFSCNSSYEQRVSSFNVLLEEQGFISIRKFRDDKGLIRNLYSIVS